MSEEIGILNEQGDIGPSFNYTVLTDEEKKMLLEEEERRRIEKEKEDSK